MIGLTFEEKNLLQMTVEQYIEYIKNFHIFSSLEISLTEEMLKSNELKFIQNSGFDLTFHVPYHLKKIPFDAAFFKSDSAQHKKETLKFIDFANAFKTSNNGIIVLHGAQSTEKDLTSSYLDFLLNYVEKKQYSLTFALENLQSDYTTYSLKEVYEMTTSFSDSKLKICYDVPNEYSINPKLSAMEKAIEDEIVHAHIHGFNENFKHQAIDAYSFSIINELLKKLDIPLYNFELLWDNSYMESLNTSIPFLKNLLKRNNSYE
ncbi:MAG: hypothetical protein JW702_03625 [Clostridiales bacterium]|nr:hypothetical protein [Clostridiales bacterium]